MPAAADDLLAPPPPADLVRVAGAVARPTAMLFGSFSRLRGRRAMHPDGVVVHARLTVPQRVDLPRRWRALDGSDGIVRFSKSVGAPFGWPDVLGIALRFGEQDLLLASAGGAPLAQHLLRPARGFTATTFSSLLLHRVGPAAAVVQARVDGRLPERGDPLEAVRGCDGARLLLSAVGLLGRRRALGTVRLGAVVTAAAAARVRFDPWRAGADLEPTGPFQRWRAAAYAASRRAAPR